MARQATQSGMKTITEMRYKWMDITNTVTYIYLTLSVNYERGQIELYVIKSEIRIWQEQDKCKPTGFKL